MVVASITACFQDDLKRMFAYSSVAQIGYITLGISLASATGLTGGIVHLFNHGVTKGALFLLAGGIAFRVGSRAHRPHRRARRSRCRSPAPASSSAAWG